MAETTNGAHSQAEATTVKHESSMTVTLNDKHFAAHGGYSQCNKYDKDSHTSVNQQNKVSTRIRHMISKSVTRRSELLG
ncbi:hypothetical protein OH492_11045 [Vibrio chagasii]|nr:hypothetical protein [Vibrio chagasii]